MNLTTFPFVSGIASLVILAAFIILSIRRFGWDWSYSRYAMQWDKAEPLGPHTYLWSAVTVIVAVLLCPAMLECADESPLQFLGFFAPAYLIVVAMTPEWETKRKQTIIHFAGTVVCASASVLWLVLALRLWFLIPIALVLAGTAGYLTKTLKECYVLWLEIAMFAAVYAAVLI